MDSSEAGWLCILTGLFVLLNSFFSLMETALTESHKSRLEKMVDEKIDGADSALAILEHPSDALAVSQAGITLMGVMAGLTCGAMALPLFNQIFDFAPRIPFLSVAVTAVGITGLMLLLGEFLPKKIALQDPEGTLVKHNAKLQVLCRLTKPLLNALSRLSDLMLIIVGVNPHIEDTVTEDEVKDLIEQGTEDGTFEKTEQAMVDRIFHLSDQTAYALMTPRTQMLWLDLSDDLKHNLRLIRQHPQKIFAVNGGNPDDFRGVLHAKDLLDPCLDNRQPELEKLIKKPLFVPRSLETFRLLDRFLSDGVHEAVVQDEYGGVVGFITLDDIMYAVLGRGRQNDGTDAKRIAGRDENSWLVSGLCSIDDFKTRFNLDELPEENRDHYQTVGGFLTSYFGYIPQKGEYREWNDLYFEILAMDRARIDKVLVRKNKDNKK